MCVPGNHQRQAPRGQGQAPPGQGRRSGFSAGPLGRWSSPGAVGSTHSSLGLTYPGAWTFLYPRAAESQTHLVSRYLSGVLGLFLRFAPHGLELNPS